jgi:Protein of unknown function (DUF3047)
MLSLKICRCDVQKSNQIFQWLCLVALFGLFNLLAGCAQTIVPTPVATRASGVASFSTAQLGELHPLAWQPWIISRFNRRTHYTIVEKDGRNVLQAFADKSASGVLQELSLDPQAMPVLRWQWKINETLPGADLATKGRDDSPVRVIVSFDGDLEKLDVEDRAMASLVKLFSGRDMPYATLMYVWDNKLPVGTMLENAHSTRAKMIVVESGAQRVGQWLAFSRDITADFQRAFGEKPGRVISVGVMSDSNTTEKTITSYYGDIALLSREEAKESRALVAPISVDAATR